MTTEYIYGINPATEVLRARHRQIQAAWLQESAAPGRLKKITTLLKKAGITPERASKQKLFQLCNSTEHQGVVLAAQPYIYTPFQDLLRQPRILLLDNVEDPQNVGAILRSAESFGWPAVLLSAKGVPAVYPSVLKASAGAAEYLQINRDQHANTYVKNLRQEGHAIVALDQNGKGTLETVLTRQLERMVLVIGGEHCAVGQFILNQADYVVSIPLRGQIGSLNASVAAGIALGKLGTTPMF